MKPQKHLYLAVSICCLALLAVFGTKWIKNLSGNKTNDTPLTTFSLANDIIDAGDVKQDVPAEAVFEIKNTGSKNLVIDNVAPDCHCTIADWDHKPVPPGQIAYIKTSYDSKSPGIFQKLVKVNANVEDSPIILVLRGNVVAPQPEHR